MNAPTRDAPLREGRTRVARAGLLDMLRGKILKRPNPWKPT